MYSKSILKSHSRLQEHQNLIQNLPTASDHGSEGAVLLLHAGPLSTQRVSQQPQQPAGSPPLHTAAWLHRNFSLNSEITGLLTVYSNEELTVLSRVHIMQKPPKRHLGLDTSLTWQI